MPGTMDLIIIHSKEIDYNSNNLKQNEDFYTLGLIVGNSNVNRFKGFQIKVLSKKWNALFDSNNENNVTDKKKNPQKKRNDSK
jgi:hypothetical protein